LARQGHRQRRSLHPSPTTSCASSSSARSALTLTVDRSSSGGHARSHPRRRTAASSWPSPTMKLCRHSRSQPAAASTSRSRRLAAPGGAANCAHAQPRPTGQVGSLASRCGRAAELIRGARCATTDRASDTRA
jgi:hypothetical protein